MNAALIKATRKKKGLTQQQMADRTGMLQPVYARLESGDANNPTFETAEKIADALGLTLDQMRLKPAKSRLSPSPRKPRKAT